MVFEKLKEIKLPEDLKIGESPVDDELFPNIALNAFSRILSLGLSKRDPALP